MNYCLTLQYQNLVNSEKNAISMLKRCLFCAQCSIVHNSQDNQRMDEENVADTQNEIAYSRKKNGILSFVTTMNLEDIVLRGIIQAQTLNNNQNVRWGHLWLHWRGRNWRGIDQRIYNFSKSKRNKFKRLVV